MARLTIDIGTDGNSATGDTLRTAFNKVNQNFSELSGNLNLSGNTLLSANTNGDIIIDPNGTGRIKLSANYWPTTDGSNGQVLSTNGSGTLSWVSNSGGSSLTVQDEGSSLSTAATTLNFVGAGVTASGTGATKTITISGGGGGASTGDITFNGSTIQSSSNADITLDPSGTGKVAVSGTLLSSGSLQVGTAGSENLIIAKGDALSTHHDTNFGAAATGLSSDDVIFVQKGRHEEEGGFIFVINAAGGPHAQSKLLMINENFLSLYSVNKDTGAKTLEYTLPTSGSINVANRLNSATDAILTLDPNGNAYWYGFGTKQIKFDDNTIRTERTNEDLQLDAAGTGALRLLTQKVFMSNLPTSDPSNAGQLWRSGNDLKVSTG